MFSKTRQIVRIRRAEALAARLRGVHFSLLLVLVLIISTTSGVGVFA